MKHEIVGYTHSDGFVICSDCEDGTTKDYGNESGKVQPIFPDAEWEYAPTCDYCLKAIEVTLTGITINVTHRFYFTEKSAAKAACRKLYRAIQSIVEWSLHEDNDESVIVVTSEYYTSKDEQREIVRRLSPNASVFNEEVEEEVQL